jgi:hypothetical protein
VRVAISIIIAILMPSAVAATWLSFTAQTAALSAASGELRQSIEVVRSQGAALETDYFLAINDFAIKEAASQLGMAPDPDVDSRSIPTGK